ncbi:hypothetical protein VNO78_06443 [Psophocarpus tetragonolobus]|uniref:Uncharacterized protein n=1 Tax=Psophocarpus tetragonolobus TaxID=3891 RepID=A0AAN9SS69_PSOTE
MAEYFVFDIAESVLRKLASYVHEEAYNVYEYMKGIKDTLSIVKGVLLDAEEKEQKHGLREWLRHIQNVCFDAEDVLDGFECQNLRKQVFKVSGSTRMKVGHFFSASNSLVFCLRRMAHQIKRVRHRLDKIVADGNKFGLERTDIDHSLVQRREMTYSYVDTSEVIGRENDREEIIRFLMKPHPHGDEDGDGSLCVILIVGIGGLVKTILAKLVFNDIGGKHEQLDIEQLQSRLRHTLSGKKYILVLDAIWNDDPGKGMELKDLIKVGAVGSKILLTTRSNTIASMMGTVPSYVLEGLSMENCFSLFVKWAFKEGEEKKYPNLVDIGKEIVKKGRGVPIALQTLGSSLFLDFGITSSEIANFWLSIGLLQSPFGSEKVENIAKRYINEVYLRSFLEDFEDFGHVYYFKLHHLVRDLASYVAEEELLVVNSYTQNIPEQNQIPTTDSVDCEIIVKFQFQQLKAKNTYAYIRECIKILHVLREQKSLNHSVNVLQKSFHLAL